MSVSTLPRPIATYFAADRANDLDALSQVFADDALVHDEAHDYRGIAAIRAWKHESQETYQYTVEVLDATVAAPSTVVRARLTGNFPGSPAELTYTFTLANDKITTLEID
jgi:hypothetical protein